eukprot:IDg22306t1
MGAYVMLTFFLQESALRTFEFALRVGSTATFVIKDWPSAVNWLLRTFATDSVIRQAVQEFRQTRQKEYEEDLVSFN